METGSIQRYVVIENTPGYVPEDDDPYVTDDLESARATLANDIERYVDHLCATYDYAADYHPDVSWSDDRESCYVLDPRREHDLGRVFEVLPADDDR